MDLVLSVTIVVIIVFGFLIAAGSLYYWQTRRFGGVFLTYLEEQKRRKAEQTKHEDF